MGRYAVIKFNAMISSTTEAADSWFTYTPRIVGYWKVLLSSHLILQHISPMVNVGCGAVAFYYFFVVPRAVRVTIR